MKRTKEPAGIKHIKDIIAEDHTEKIQRYHDTPAMAEAVLKGG